MLACCVWLDGIANGGGAGERGWSAAAPSGRRRSRGASRRILHATPAGSICAHATETLAIRGEQIQTNKKIDR